MAIITFMGFDHVQTSSAYDPTRYPELVFSTSAGWGKYAGQLQGYGIASNSSGRALAWSNGVNYATIIAGWRGKLTSAGGGSGLVEFNDGSTTQVWITHASDNRIKAYRGSGTANLLATSINTFLPTSWIWIEIKVTIHNTTGAVKVVVGGVTEIDVSGINTRVSANNYLQYVYLWSGQSGQNDIIDDVYFADTTGSAPTNDIIGVPLIVETLYPTAADSTTWTPNASTNLSRIQEVHADDDTTYNSDSTSGHIDLYTHGAMASTPAAIYGVAVVSRARKDDVAARNYRHKLVSGATTVTGVSTSMDTIYKWVKDVYLTDPNTGVAWTPTAVNATKIGYENV